VHNIDGKKDCIVNTTSNILCEILYLNLVLEY